MVRPVEAYKAGSGAVERGLPLAGGEVLTGAASGDERDLVARAQTDPEAFGVLFDRYYSRVYAFAYQRLASKAEAEDVAAETFSRSLAHLTGFRWTSGGFAAWVFRIARNLCYDYLQARSRTRPVGDETEAGEAGSGGRAGRPLRVMASGAGEEPGDPEEAVLEAELVSRLKGLVAGLPDAHREALYLKYTAGLGNHQIAEATGRTPRAVAALLHRITQRLREGLAQDDA